MTDAGLSDGATSATARSWARAGAARSGPAAREDAFAGAARGATLRFDLASAVIRAAGALATALPRRSGAGDLDGAGAGPLAIGRPIDACCKVLGADVIAGCAVVPGVGTSTTRSSGASTRRSRQGKPKPGSPSPWPPKVRLKISV